jgi:small-conductance mechanosensitive channel
MIVTNWIDTTIIALKSLWIGFINFIPSLIGALLVFIIGWVIAVAVGKLVAEILKKIRLNQVFEKGAWKTALEKSEIKVDAAAFIGAIIKWVLMIAFLIAALQILGLNQLKDFFVDVLNYLPNVVVASFILVVAIIIADILEKVVRATIEGVRIGYGQLVGAIIKWSIWIFAILAIMLQLGIAEDLVKTIIQGVVALLVIAGGLAFGLGGKDLAADILQDLRNKLSR